MPRENFDKLDFSFHLDETEAKIYGFLEKNVDRAFTLFEIYLNAFVDDMFKEQIRNTLFEGDYINHPLYQVLQKKIEGMVKDGKIAGRYQKGKFFYAV